MTLSNARKRRFNRLVMQQPIGLVNLFLSQLDQYAIAKFAESFEMIPKTLAENAGLNAMDIISSLYAEHASGNTKVGIDLEEGVCKDVSTVNVWDLPVTKLFALKYAADAACTVLQVDQKGVFPGNGYGSSRLTYTSKRTHSHIPESNFCSRCSTSSNAQTGFPESIPLHLSGGFTNSRHILQQERCRVVSLFPLSRRGITRCLFSFVRRV